MGPGSRSLSLAVRDGVAVIDIIKQHRHFGSEAKCFVALLLGRNKATVRKRRPQGAPQGAPLRHVDLVGAPLVVALDAESASIAVMPRVGRAPSTPRLLDSIITTSGMLDRPRLRTMTVENAAMSRAMTHIRNCSAARCARELSRNIRPFEKRARGMPGAQCTRSPVCAMG
jgi:hypothetical protein